MAISTFSDSVAAVTLVNGSITGIGTLTGSSFNIQEGTINCALAGSLAALTKNQSIVSGGTNTVTLTGNSNYGGTTTINQGTIQITSSSALASTSVTVKNSSTLLLNGVSFTNALTLNDNATLIGTGGAFTNFSKTGSPAIGAGASVTIATSVASDKFSITSAITGGNAASVINVQGPGSINIAAGSTASTSFAGSWILNSTGTLQLSNANALGNPGTNNQRPITLISGTLELRANSDATFSQATTIAGNVTILASRTSNGASVTHSLGTLKVDDGLAALNALSLTISHGNSFSANNTGSVLFGATTLTDNLTLALNNTNGTAIGVNTLGSLNDGGSVAKTLTKSGAATLTLPTAASSLITGTAVNIAWGALNANNAASLGSGANVTLSTGATFNVNASQAISALNSASPADTGAVVLGANTLTVGNSSGIAGAFRGVIGNATSGSLTKIGTNDQSLAGANLYTGPTTISGGRLLVDGSLAAASAVTVQTGGILGGVGSVPGAVSVLATAAIDPGDVTVGVPMPGKLTLGSVTFADNSFLTAQINGQALAGSDFDQLIVTGTATINAGAILGITNDSGYSPTPGDSIPVLTAGALITSGAGNAPFSYALTAKFRPQYIGGTLNLLENRLPIAEAGGPYSVNLGDGTSFDGSASTDPDSSLGDAIVTYSWDLNDDNVFGDATGSQPSITAGLLTSLGAGVHTIQLQVSDSTGDSSIDTAVLTIYDNRPTAVQVVTPNPGSPNQPVLFDASGSTHGRPDRNIVQFTWDFGDGNAYTETAANAPDGSYDGETTHSYPLFGSYNAQLTVTDNNVPAQTDSTFALVSIAIVDQPPISNPGGPYSLQLGSGITLDGTASSDPDAGVGDEIVSYEWDIDGNGSFTDSIDVFGAQPDVSASTISVLGAGSHTITLRVTDALGSSSSASTTLEVTALNTAPTVSLLGPDIATEGQAAHYSFTTLDPDAGDTFSVVAITAGTLGTISNLQFSSLTGAGSFDVTFSDGLTGSTVGIQIKDSANAVSNVDSIGVTVTDQPQTRTITAAGIADWGLNYSFGVHTSDPGDDTVSHFTIDWGDGVLDTNVAAGARLFQSGTYQSDTSFSHNYNTLGLKHVTITAFDDDGEYSDTFDVTVINNAPAANAGTGYSISEGADLHLNGGASTDPNSTAGDSIQSYQWAIAGPSGTATAIGVAPTVSWAILQSIGIIDDGEFDDAISLTVSDSIGALSTATADLSITNTSPARILSAANTADWGLSYSFGLGTTDPGDDGVFKVVANWGDGSSDDVVFPNAPRSLVDGNWQTDFSLNHTYSTLSLKHVTLTTFDEDGSYANAFDITVVNTPPVANAGYTQPMFEGDSLSLDGTASFDSNSAAGDNIQSYQWIISGPAGTVNATGSMASINWETLRSIGIDDNGHYPAAIQLTVTDTQGAQATATADLAVDNVAPTVAIEQNAVYADLGSVYGAVVHASDVGNDIVDHVLVDWGDGSAIEAFMSAARTFDGAAHVWDVSTAIAHTYSTFGSKHVVVTAFDDDGSYQTSFDVSVVDNSPHASQTSAPQPVLVGEPITFDASDSSQGRPDRSIVEYHWDFGDGSSYAESASSHSDGTFDGKTTHIYPVGGSYSVVLTVTDNNLPAKSDSTTTTVTVNTRPIAAIVGGDRTINVGNNLILDASGSFDPDGVASDTITLYSWYLDAASTPLLTSASATNTANWPTLAANGVGPEQHHTLRLVVRDSRDATSENAATIELITTSVAEVPGTAGDDVLTVDFVANTYILNGGNAEPLSGITEVSFDGGTGDDAVEIQKKGPTQQRCSLVVEYTCVKAFQNPRAPSPVANLGSTTSPRLFTSTSKVSHDCSLSR